MDGVRQDFRSIQVKSAIIATCRRLAGQVQLSCYEREKEKGYKRRNRSLA